MSEAKLVERLLSKVAMPSSFGACWPWLGCANKKGYGFAWDGRDGKRGREAYRIVYEIAIGPVPAGLVLDHLCRNRRCVNPLHLEPVTNVENVARGLRGAAAVRLTAPGAVCVNGHDVATVGVYRYPNGQPACRACRRDHINRWRHRKTA